MCTRVYKRDGVLCDTDTIQVELYCTCALESAMRDGVLCLTDTLQVQLYCTCALESVTEMVCCVIQILYRLNYIAHVH